MRWMRPLSQPVALHLLHGHMKVFRTVGVGQSEVTRYPDITFEQSSKASTFSLHTDAVLTYSDVPRAVNTVPFDARRPF